MQEFRDKTAFITGGASGIGLAMAKAFAEAGMKLMLADIEQDALVAAIKSLAPYSAHGVTCDVADPDSVERAAQETFATFGKVHVLCNNAGVAAGGGIDSISIDNWRWVIDVNLMGVVHGLKSFLPQMRGHGEGGHIVNTASMAGLNAGLGISPYVASKFAVVAMSEGLAVQLAPHGHRCDRAVPELRAHPDRRKRAQPAAALWRGGAARSGGAVRADDRRDRKAHRCGARPRRGRRTCRQRYPRERVLFVHASEHA